MNHEAEQNELNHLYELATAELADTDEKLIVWAGGDAPHQQDTLADKFSAHFPKVPIEIRVDLSKYHNAKIYQQLLDGHLEPDIAMLQTTNDFENWKVMNYLEPFQPASFNHLHPGYSDPEGHFLAAYIACFVPQYATHCVKQDLLNYEDFLDPVFKYTLVLTPPHDDDAVLFVYDHIIRAYSPEFLLDLKAQSPTFMRGTAAPAALVGYRRFLGNLTGYFTTTAQPAHAFIPQTDFFITWPQRAAMFKLTKHKHAARLFLAYITSHEYQSQRGSWSTRMDVEPPPGLKPLQEYDNTNPLEFIGWMRDRERLHVLRTQMEEIFGPVEGESPLTDPSLLRIYREYPN